MDAKPQRPLRSMRTFNDENAHPDGPLPKTIHHRNKSSPALSSVAGVGFKNAAKRTAFGDVSNTAGTVRSAKEDATNLSKPGQAPSKLSHTIHERRSAAFLRPAQRPISVSSLRNLLIGSSNNNNNVVIEQQQRQSLNDAPVTQQTTNGRRFLTKRNTTIFKDTSLVTVQEDDQSDPQKAPVPTIPELPNNHPIPSIEVVQEEPQLKLPPPTTAIITEPVKVPHDVAPKPLPEISEHTFANDLPTSSEVYPDVTSDSDVNAVLSSIQSLPLPPQDVALIPTFPPAGEALPVTAIRKSDAQPPLPILEPAVGLYVFAPLTQEPLAPLPARAEPEEYWEDEEDTCEEEGYVTARSFRSKGDNTTGGVTTVLVPRMNQVVRREIEAATKLVEATRTAEEVEDESFDTSMVAEYGDEIFDYMRQLEVKMSPNPHYMDNQHEIQWSMRSVLMDWLVQVHHRFNLLPETLFLCVNYIDRFLSCKVVSLGKLQLVGATAIFIAAKYEEINCPSVQEIVYMVDGGYSIDEILKAERFMLTMLQFELGWPGPMSFLRRISKADDYDLETRTLAKYFLEVTLMDERFIGSPPSFTAAASHCLARLMLRKGNWSPHHVYYSGYTYNQLKPLVQLLLECCEDPAKHHRAVFDKYCDKRYKRASVFVQTEIQKGFNLSESPAIKLYPHSPTYAYYTNAPYFRG